MLINRDQDEVLGVNCEAKILAYGEKIGIPDLTVDLLIKSHSELAVRLADLRRRLVGGSESKIPLYCVTSGRTPSKDLQVGASPKKGSI